VVIDSPDAEQALLAKLGQLPGPFGLDTETVDCNPRTQSPVHTAKLVCWSLAWYEPGAEDANRAFLWADSLPVFKRWLENWRVPKVGQNLYTYDRHVFFNVGITLRGIVGDTQVISRLLSLTNEHGLKFHMESTLGYEPVGEFRELFTKPVIKLVDEPEETARRKVGGKFISTLFSGPRSEILDRKETVPLDEIRFKRRELLETLYDYASFDAKATLELYTFFKRRLKAREATGLCGIKIGKLADLYSKWWNCQSLLLTRYERAGVSIDLAACTAECAVLDKQIAALQVELAPWAAGVNLASSKQLAEFLYTTKGFEVPRYCGSSLGAVKRTQFGKQPTDLVALSNLEHDRSISLEDRAHLRNLVTLKGLVKSRQFASKFGQYLCKITGRVHTVLSPEAETGRLSSKNPALQQIPKKGALRKAFVAAPGHKLIVADFSQLELFVLAHFTKKLFGCTVLEGLLAAGDMHSEMALRCWPDKLQGITAAEIKGHKDPSVRALRDAAKAVGYGINYGKTAAGLGLSLRGTDGLPIGTEAAQEILDAFNNAIPSIARFQKFAIEYARKHYGIHTLLGRFRPLPEINSEEKWIRLKSERAALNTPIQGSAHDVVLTAMLRLNTYPEPELELRGWFCPELAELKARAILQVHDEIQWEVPTANAEAAAVIVKQIMESPLKPGVLLVPLKADVAIANNWGDAK
jgi:DNA polymerase-1